MDQRQSEILANCEALGEAEVRRRYFASEYSAERDRLMVEGWLSSKEAARQEAFNTEQALTAQRSLSLAKLATFVSLVAAFAAIIAAIPVLIAWQR